jgi:hypothetical protein
MSSPQENARMLLRDAAKRMVQAEYAEAEAMARLCVIPDDATKEQIDEWLAAANLACAFRTQAQLHYANCRQHLRMTWESRGEEFPRPFSVVQAEGGEQ